jgi:hypothetical protein
VRTIFSTALIVLLTVLTPLSAVAAWFDLEIGDSGRFVSTLAPLASDRDVQNAVTDRVTDTVMARIDAGPLQHRVRDLVHENVRSFTTTAAFETAWTTAVRAAHATTEQVLTGETGHSVTVDLAPVMTQVKKQLVADRVPFAAALPPLQHTTITILRPKGLGTWHGLALALRTAGVWVGVGTLLLAAGAVLVAVRRRRALIGAGVAFAVGGMLLTIAVTVGRQFALGDVRSPVDRLAAGAVYDVLTASLRTTAWALLAAGLVLAAVAWLTGVRRSGGSLYLRGRRRAGPEQD